MLPNFLKGRYRQYKDDTKTLAVWLVSTARSLGYVSEALPSTSETLEKIKKPKSKGSKTKKQIRDATRHIPRALRRFTISIDEFIALAEYIIKHHPEKRFVPKSTHAIIESTIRARVETKAWYKSQNQADIGHDHFVSILLILQDLLQPYIAHVATNENKCSAVSESSFNYYDGLDVEMTSDEFANSPGPKFGDHSAERQQEERGNMWKQLMQRSFEARIAACSLFKDANDIINEATATWERYKHNEVDLTTAAMISNTAIDMIRRLEDAFFEEFPVFYHVDDVILKVKAPKRFNDKHKDAKQLVNYMFRLRAQHRDLAPDEDTDQVFQFFNPKLCNEARETFMDVYSTWIQYQLYTQHLDKWVYQAPPEIGWWKPTDVNILDQFERYKQERRVLLELFPDILLLSTSASKIAPLAECELLKGSRDLCYEPRKMNDKVHLWTLASMRLLINTHNVLGADIGKPFEHIRQLGKEILATIDECKHQRETGRYVLWPKGADSHFEAHVEKRINQSLFVDEVKEYIDHCARNVKKWPGKKDFELLSRHPWLCGLMEFNMRQIKAEIGLYCMDYTKSVLTVAHLYNALQQELDINAKWADLEDFIDLAGEKEIFIGQRPEKLEDYAKRLYMVQGMSPETFLPNRRRRGIVTSKKGRRQVTPTSPLLSVLMSRHSLITFTVNVENSKCLTDLESLQRELDIHYKVEFLEDRMIARTHASADSEKRRNKELYKNSIYKPTELLFLFRFGLMRELPKLDRNYLDLHRSAWDFLTSFREDCLPHLTVPIDAIIEAVVKPCEAASLRMTHMVTLAFAGAIRPEMAGQMVRSCVMPTIPTVSEDQRMAHLEAFYQMIYKAGQLLVKHLQKLDGADETRQPMSAPTGIVPEELEMTIESCQEVDEGTTDDGGDGILGHYQDKDSPEFKKSVIALRGFIMEQMYLAALQGYWDKRKKKF